MQKPKILMVGDIPYWAYYYMAEYVIKELSSKYDFYKDYCLFHRHFYNKNSSIYWRPLKQIRLIKNYYLLKYYYKRRLLPHRQEYDLICYLGWYFPHLYDFKIKGKRQVQGIFSDGFPPQAPSLPLDPQIGILEFVNKYLGRAVSVVCGSRTIYERYQRYVNCNYCTGAIDTQMFKPSIHKKIKKDSFVVGWTGNPNRSFKGFYDFVVPAVEKASSLRKGVVLKTRFKGPYQSLPKFYDNVDILLIASSADAGPSSFLEAGASGVPSISTRIGFPAETIIDGENGLFVNRSIEEMVRAILYFYDHRDHLQKMSENIRQNIERDWDYKSRSRLWDQMFEESLSDRYDVKQKKICES